MRGLPLSMTSFALVLVGLAAPAAVAQNALGDGRALDNNLSTRGRYNQERTSLRQELTFRNSIVTGNAPGGLSFRGDVGYVAPGEFTGDPLGSNDLYAFRRDSLRSGIAGMGIRGTEALQYQLSLTTGSRPPANLVGRYSVSRSGSGTSGYDLSATRRTHDRDEPALSQRPAIDPEADDRGTMLWMLRSPSAFISNSSLQTSALRRVEANNKQYTLTASPLRGGRLSPVPDLTASDDRGDPGSRVVDEPAEGEGNAGRPGWTEPGRATPEGRTNENRPESGTRPGSRPGTQPGSGEGSGSGSGSGSDSGSSDDSNMVRTLHGDIVRRLMQNEQERQSADMFDMGPDLQTRMKRLTDKLQGRDEDDGLFGSDGAAEGEDGEEAMDWTKGPTSEELSASRRIRFDPETMKLLRGDGTTIERYVSTRSEGRNFYAEHLLAGQELMAEGRYFDAEERFAHALGVLRGDVTAQIARLHAQIGAGLFLSASLNMQTLASERPEVFAARYGEKLLPSRERLEQLVTLFQNTIDPDERRGRTSSPTIRRASALLLAYIGFQMDREDLVRQGLDDYRERVTEDVAPGETLPVEARLEALFRELWLPAEDKPDASVEAEPNPAGGEPDEPGEGDG